MMILLKESTTVALWGIIGSFKRGISGKLWRAFNVHNALGLPLDTPMLKAKVVGDAELHVRVYGRQADKVVNSAEAITAALTGKFEGIVVSNGRLSKEGNWVVFDLEDTNRDYRIRYEDPAQLIQNNGNVMLDRRPSNVWNWRVLPNLLLSGPTGSGKSTLAGAVVHALHTMPGIVSDVQEVRMWGIDAKRGELTDWGRELDFPVANDWESAMTIMRTVIREMKRRQQTGDNVVPGFLVIEEQAALLVMAPDSKAEKEYMKMLKQLLVMVRSANLHVISILQAATAPNLGGQELRGQYGVKVALMANSQDVLGFLFPAGTKPKNFGVGEGYVLIDGAGSQPHVLEAPTEV